MGDNINLGMIELNAIKLVIKPSVANKLGFKESTLQWCLFRADKLKNTVELSGYGMPKDNINLEERQLDDLKLSDYPRVFGVFMKELKKRVKDVDFDKIEVHKMYMRVSFSESQCYSQLFFMDLKDNKLKKTPNIISKF